MVEKNSKEELFEKIPVKIAVAKLAIPTMAASIVMVLYNLADTFFVGLLDNPIATGAVTLATPVILAFNAVTNLFGVGSSSLMSRALGVKDYQTVKKTSAFGIYCAILCGALFSFFCTVLKTPLLNILGADASNFIETSEYLYYTVTLGAIPSILNVVFSNMFRSEGLVGHASIGVMSGCFLNIILDPFFILPKFLNMGAAGAGYATFISNCVACLYFIVLLIIKKENTFVCVKPSMAIPTKRIFAEVFGVGIPASIQNLLNVIGATILNNIAAKYGNEAVSAIGITHKLAMVPLYFSMGAGQGILPLIGYNYAAKNASRVKETIRFAQVVVVISMSIAAALIYVYSKQCVNCFMDNALVVEYGTGFLRGFTLAVPFLAFDFLGVAIFQACGLGKLSLIFAIARKMCLEIPSIFILDKLFGMHGMVYCQLVAEFVLAIASFLVIEKILKKVENLAQNV